MGNIFGDLNLEEDIDPEIGPTEKTKTCVIYITYLEHSILWIGETADNTQYIVKLNDDNVISFEGPNGDLKETYELSTKNDIKSSKQVFLCVPYAFSKTALIGMSVGIGALLLAGIFGFSLKTLYATEDSSTRSIYDYE